MSLGRRILRASALARASLALMGTSGAFFSVPLLPLAVIAQQQPAAEKKVAINILVIEADKKSTTFDKQVEPLKGSLPGYTGGKVLDELKTSIEVGSSVSLEIARQSGEKRLLKVTLRKVAPDGSIRLRVAIDAIKFDSDTTHPKKPDGSHGTIVVGKAISAEKALFLAVTPQL
jgi:hypothetical protein